MYHAPWGTSRTRILMAGKDCLRTNPRNVNSYATVETSNRPGVRISK
jgi:hypothetical protein